MFSINKAHINDFVNINRLAREIWNEHYTPIIGEEQVDFMLNKFQSVSAMELQMSEGFVYYLLKVSGKLVGYVAIKIDNFKAELFLSKFYLTKSQRRNGYGKSVMSFLKEITKQHKLKSIRLTVNKFNKNTIAAYQRFGFVISKEVVFDIGQGYIMDDYEMIYNEKV